MAFPQTKTPLPLTVRKRQRRINSSAVPLLLPVQSPAPQCASNNARPVITGACRSRLLGRIHRPFSRKARRGSSHGHPALPCTIRQLSVGTLSGVNPFSRYFFAVIAFDIVLNYRQVYWYAGCLSSGNYIFSCAKTAN